MSETKSATVRVDQGLLDWADGYAASRGVSRTELFEQALVDFRADCVAGVPEIRRRAREQTSVWDRVRGRPEAGRCPRHPEGGGHIWSNEEMERRPCVFGCGMNGRGPGGFFERATGERTELFSRIVAPRSAHGQRVREARA